MGKDALFVTLEDWLAGLTGSSTPAGTSCTDSQFIGNSYLTALLSCDGLGHIGKGVATLRR